MGFHDVVIRRQGSGRDAPRAGNHLKNADEQDEATSESLRDGRDEIEGTKGTSNGSGPPIALVRADDGEQFAQISISHDGDYATAVCLGFDPRFSGQMGSGG